MTGTLRAIYRYWAAILLAAVIVQFFLAGLGVFGVVAEAAEGEAAVSQDTIEDEFTPHAILGSFILLGSLLLFLIALGARLGRNRVLWSLAVPVLVFLQLILAGVGEDSSFVGALHVVNALVITGLLGWLTYNAWRRWTDVGAAGERRATAT